MEYADDAALVALSRSAAVHALTVFCNVAKEFGLTVSLVKTKFLVAGVAVTFEDQADIIIDGSSVQCVSDFPHLGSLITADTRTSHDTQRRIRLAS